MRTQDSDLILAEEFGYWEDSHLRIDLIGVDDNASLVVIELKRFEDGRYMELQALRDAAMVSAITFDAAVEVYDQYLKQSGQDVNPRDQLLEFLGWKEPDEDKFARDLRIILASVEFSKEITTSAL